MAAATFSRVQSAPEKQRNVDRLSYLATQTPVVCPPGAAQFLNCQRLITRIQQDRIDVRSHRHRFVYGLGTGDVYDLHKRDAGQSFAKLLMTSVRKSIANLDRVYFQPSLLIDDRRGVFTAVSRNELTPGGTVAAISAISVSGIGPGPLGIADTSPIADAPCSIAIHASATLAMQQIFTRGLFCRLHLLTDGVLLRRSKMFIAHECLCSPLQRSGM